MLHQYGATPGGWDSNNYIEFLKIIVRKEKYALNKKDPYYGGVSKKWIQDNAPCHCSVDTKKYISTTRQLIIGYEFSVCPPGGVYGRDNDNAQTKKGKRYPPNSPDFNPSEYIICQLKNDI